jgi:hypothetical protein
VVVDGVRIPFVLSNTTYIDHMAVDLARMAITGLVTKTGIDPKVVDYLLYGTVISEPKVSRMIYKANILSRRRISLARLGCTLGSQLACRRIPSRSLAFPQTSLFAREPRKFSR